jgi:hypothetical protein
MTPEQRNRRIERLLRRNEATIRRANRHMRRLIDDAERSEPATQRALEQLRRRSFG